MRHCRLRAAWAGSMPAVALPCAVPGAAAQINLHTDRLAMEPEQYPTTPPVQSIVVTAAMVLGVVLIGFGLWALGGAIYAAWGLFRDPDSIGYFTRYFLETTHLGAELNIDGRGLAHYVSWVAVVLLLLVLGKLGAWAVTAGGRLVAPRRLRDD